MLSAVGARFAAAGFPNPFGFALATEEVRGVSEELAECGLITRENDAARPRGRRVVPHLRRGLDRGYDRGTVRSEVRMSKAGPIAPLDAGQVKVGPLTVNFPDPSFSTFWFMHDLVDVLGVEGNSEARAKLKEKLRGRRGVRLDHEADYVFAHARGVDAMLDVLAAIAALAPRAPLWSSEEFDAAARAMRKWKRPLPVPYGVGTVVACPFAPLDPAGRFGGAVVAAFESLLWSPDTRAESPQERGSPLLFVLELAAPSIAELARDVEGGNGKAHGCSILLDTEIVSGAWPVIGGRKVDEDEARRALERERHESTTAGALAGLAMHYAGLIAWDAGASTWADDKLLPGVSAPEDRRLVRDLLEGRLRAAFGRIPEPVSEGPAVLHVHIAYPGNGPPRIIDFPKAHKLAEKAKGTVPGADVVFTGCGGGFLDVIAHTSDARAGLRAVEQAVSELRLSKDTLIDCYPDVRLDDLYLVERTFPPAASRE
jgi:hypothetical protein